MTLCPRSWIGALALAWGLAGASARAGDVAWVSVFKTAWYVQDRDAEPELLPQAENPFDLLARAQLSPEFLADPDNLLFISGMTLRTPAGQTYAMNFDPAGGLFWYYAGAVTAQALNQRHPPGDYRFTLRSLISGDLPITVPLAADDYPPAPRLLNFPAAQAINPAQDFTLRWNEFAGAGSRDIRLEIARADTADVVLAEGPLSGDLTALPIPADTLEPDTGYLATLSFTRFTVASPGSDPAMYAGFEAHTRFPLRTAPRGDLPPPRFTGWRRLPEGDLELTLDHPPGAALTLLGSETPTGPWLELETRPTTGTTTTFVVPAAQLGDRRFFRARKE